MVSGPFPRRYDIIFTLHLRERSALREISLDDVKKTIGEGSERPLPGRGVNGGIRCEFILGNVVVISEIVGDTCHVLTTYKK